MHGTKRTPIAYVSCVVDVNHKVNEDDVGHELAELNPAYLGWVSTDLNSVY